MSVDPGSENGIGHPRRDPSRGLAMPKPGSQGVRCRTQGNATPRLAEVLEISVDVIGREALERKSPLVQIEEEMPDVPVSVLARCQRQPALLALDLGNLPGMNNSGPAAGLDRVPGGPAVPKSRKQRSRSSA